MNIYELSWEVYKKGEGNSLPGYQSAMAIIRYNGRFVITAKSLWTNVAVVTRVDCTAVLYNVHVYIHINCPEDNMKISNGLTLNISHHRICPAGGISPIRTGLVLVGKTSKQKMYITCNLVILSISLLQNNFDLTFLIKIFLSNSKLHVDIARAHMYPVWVRYDL